MMNNMTFGIVALIAVPIILIALVVLFFALRGRRKVRASMNWNETIGTVLFSEVEERRSYSSESGTTISYYPKIVYEYQVMGQRYQSQRFNLGEVGIGNYNKVAAKTAQYPQGGQVPVYYNPDNPQEAVLERAAPSSNVLLIVVVVIFAMLGCTLVMTMGGFMFINNLVSGFMPR
jgi:hypothetical protein